MSGTPWRFFPANIPGEETLNNLIGAGPITAVAIAFVLVAFALIILAIAISRGVGAFINIYTTMNQSLRLTRKAVVKSAEANAKGLSEVARVASEIRDEAKARHTELSGRVTAAETSITALEGSTSALLKPLVQKVDDLITKVELLHGATVNKGDLETFVAGVRSDLRELEIHIVQKFGGDVLTLDVGRASTAESSSKGEGEPNADIS